MALLVLDKKKTPLMPCSEKQARTCAYCGAKNVSLQTPHIHCGCATHRRLWLWCHLNGGSEAGRLTALRALSDLSPA